MPDLLRLGGLTVDCIVGVYPSERHRPQPLELDLVLHLDLDRAAREERVAATVDYAVLAETVAFLLRAARFRLLETAALVLLRLLLLPPGPGERRPVVARARVSIAKPRALPGGALPSVRLERAAVDVVAPREDGPAGTVEVLHDGRDARVTRHVLRAGAALPVADGAVFVLYGAIDRAGRRHRQGPLTPPSGPGSPIVAAEAGAVLLVVETRAP